MSIVHSGIVGACIAMSRASSSRRKSDRISDTTVELPVERAIREVEREVELEEEILVPEEVRLPGELGLAVDRLLHRRELIVARVHRRELGDARLEQPPRLEHAGHLADAHLPSDPDEIARHQLAANEDAARLTAPHLEHAGVDQRLDGLADGRPADLHLRGEIALGRQPVAGVKVPRAHLVGDLLERFLERAARRDRLELAFHRQRVYGGASAQATAASPREPRSRRARSTRSSACRSATVAGGSPVRFDSASASSSRPIAVATCASTSASSARLHSAEQLISPPQLARKSGT